MGITFVSKIGALIAITAVSLAGCTGSDEPPSAAFEDCADEALPTLAVKARATRDAYRPGQFAVFKVLVNRAVQPDEHGESGSYAIGPVEGAQVGLGVSVADVSLTGGGTTDEEGRTTIKIMIARYVPAGVADVLASATADSSDLECVPSETGHVEKHGLFRVIR